jgi:class 3 adenylate cyclase
VFPVGFGGGSLRYSDPACVGSTRAKEQSSPGQGSDRCRGGRARQNHLDLFGSTVQLAARLCSHTRPEQILVSNVVAELCIGKGLTFQDLGEVSLNGFDRPIRVHAIKQPGEH